MNTNDLVLFTHTADTGSITKAAEHLDMTSASASAALKRLEKQLDTQLFIRSTRQLRITAEGERFLIYCREALEKLEEGKASIQALDGKVAGELRISAPSDIGRNLIVDWVDEVMDDHPDLSISLMLGDSIADFYLDKVDLAVRYGNQEDSSMVAFKLVSIERILCASPSYIQQHGMPEQILDLHHHQCLLLHMNNRIENYWEFVHKDDSNDKYKLKLSSKRSANDADIVRRWAVDGKGIAYKSVIDVTHDLQEGNLVRVLPNYQSTSIDLSLMSPTRAQITPAVLLLRDILRQKFQQLLST